jgi:hypothetical protein
VSGGTVCRWPALIGGGWSSFAVAGGGWKRGEGNRLGERERVAGENEKMKAKENAPPSDPNMPCDSKQSPAKLKSPLPPRPPSSNPLKRKLSMETVPENSVPGGSDSGVKVSVLVNPRVLVSFRFSIIFLPTKKSGSCVFGY